MVKEERSFHCPAEIQEQISRHDNSEEALVIGWCRLLLVKSCYALRIPNTSGLLGVVESGVNFGDWGPESAGWERGGAQAPGNVGVKAALARPARNTSDYELGTGASPASVTNLTALFMFQTEHELYRMDGDRARGTPH